MSLVIRLTPLNNVTEKDFVKVSSDVTSPISPSPVVSVKRLSKAALQKKQRLHNGVRGTMGSGKSCRKRLLLQNGSSSVRTKNGGCENINGADARRRHHIPIGKRTSKDHKKAVVLGHNTTKKRARNLKRSPGNIEGKTQRHQPIVTSKSNAAKKHVVAGIGGKKLPISRYSAKADSNLVNSSNLHNAAKAGHLSLDHVNSSHRESSSLPDHQANQGPTITRVASIDPSRGGVAYEASDQGSTHSRQQNGGRGHMNGPIVDLIRGMDRSLGHEPGYHGSTYARQQNGGRGHMHGAIVDHAEGMDQSLEDESAHEGSAYVRQQNGGTGLTNGAVVDHLEEDDYIADNCYEDFSSYLNGGLTLSTYNRKGQSNEDEFAPESPSPVSRHGVRCVGIIRLDVSPLVKKSNLKILSMSDKFVTREKHMVRKNLKYDGVGDKVAAHHGPWSSPAKRSQDGGVSHGCDDAYANQFDTSLSGEEAQISKRGVMTPKRVGCDGALEKVPANGRPWLVPTHEMEGQRPDSHTNDHANESINDVLSLPGQRVGEEGTLQMNGSDTGHIKQNNRQASTFPHDNLHLDNSWMRDADHGSDDEIGIKLVSVVGGVSSPKFKTPTKSGAFLSDCIEKVSPYYPDSSTLQDSGGVTHTPKKTSELSTPRKLQVPVYEGVAQREVSGSQTSHHRCSSFDLASMPEPTLGSHQHEAHEEVNGTKMLDPALKDNSHLKSLGTPYGTSVPHGTNIPLTTNGGSMPELSIHYQHSRHDGVDSARTHNKADDTSSSLTAISASTSENSLTPPQRQLVQNVGITRIIVGADGSSSNLTANNIYTSDHSSMPRQCHAEQDSGITRTLVGAHGPSSHRAANTPSTSDFAIHSQHQSHEEVDGGGISASAHGFSSIFHQSYGNGDVDASRMLDRSHGTSSHLYTTSTSKFSMPRQRQSQATIDGEGTSASTSGLASVFCQHLGDEDVDGSGILSASRGTSFPAASSSHQNHGKVDGIRMHERGHGRSSNLAASAASTSELYLTCNHYNMGDGGTRRLNTSDSSFASQISTTGHKNHVGFGDHVTSPVTDSAASASELSLMGQQYNEGVSGTRRLDASDSHLASQPSPTCHQNHVGFADITMPDNDDVTSFFTGDAAPLEIKEDIGAGQLSQHQDTATVVYQIEGEPENIRSISRALSVKVILEKLDVRKEDFVKVAENAKKPERIGVEVQDSVLPEYGTPAPDTPEKFLQCGICSEPFQSERELNIHFMKHLLGKPHRCSSCDEGFKHYGTMRAHEIKCKAIKNLATLRVALNRREKLYHCKVCRKVFKSDLSLSHHMWRCHIHASGSLFKCPLCAKAFPKKRGCKNHIKWKHVMERHHECDICGKKFHRGADVNKHKIKHGSDKMYSCEICDREFNRKSTLVTHRLTHSKETRWACDLCDKKFYTYSAVYSHTLRHHGTEEQKSKLKCQCNICGKMQPNKAALKVHMNTHTNEFKYKCEKCGKSFNRSSSLLTHRKYVHSTVRPFKCKRCGAAFKQMSNLRAHMVVHKTERPYKCTECGKAFSRSTYLKLHAKIVHERARPFGCEICGLDFATRARLSRHMLIHDENHERWECKLCKKTFAYKYGLDRHHKVHHEKILRFPCKFCDAVFGYNDSLQFHITTVHMKETPFSCPVCHRAFGRKSSLLKHKRTHTGDQRYKCMYCEKTFGQRPQLDNHIRTHTKEKPFQCEYCDRRLGHRSSLQSHIRSFHTFDKPYLCKVCGKAFAEAHQRSSHMHVHTNERNPLKCYTCDRIFSSKVITRHHIKVFHGGKDVENESD